MRKRFTKTCSVAAAATALGLAVSGTPALADGGFTPGAPTAGDPYFPFQGNGGYHADHYDLTLTYNAKTTGIQAVAKVQARATQNLSRFDLDFRGMRVGRVTVNGQPAGSARAGKGLGEKLVITPRHGLRKGTKFQVSVAYSGVPVKVVDKDQGISGWVRTSSGGIVALGQPFGSSAWYPVNDHLSDKASYSFTVTVPKGLTALANGVAAGRRAGKGTTTFRWIAREPMASELSMLAIGKFDVTSGRTASGIPNITAVDSTLTKQGRFDLNRMAAQKPETAGKRDGATATTPPPTAAALQKLTSDIVGWASKIYGRYPFAATGGVIVDSKVDYALETQGRPAYDTNSLKVPTTIVHELAHQWYGDSLTPLQWKHIWLNEGFATYAQWLYAEQHGGPSAQKTADDTYDAAKPEQWKTVVADPGGAKITDWAVYQRAAMTLQALRKTIGDAAFFKLLKAWPAAHRYGLVTTDQFVALAKKISGKNLDGLFKAWIHSDTRPPRP